MKVPGSVVLTCADSIVLMRLVSANRAEHAEDQADGDQQQTLADDESDYVARLGAERHAHAELVGALGDRVGHHRVEADARRG